VRRRSFSHVVGFDDAPFLRYHRGDVPIIGAVYAGLRLEGILAGRVRRDGSNATQRLAQLIKGSKFERQLQLVMLQGIALAGFNVVDVEALHRVLGLPVLVVVRKRPRLEKVRRALLARVPSGERKWRLIERLGPVDWVAGLYVQRVGMTLDEVAGVIRRLAVHSHIPEPLRTAHLIAGGIALGQSRGRP
jgi:endonuclease V-like protein UPF0215 family